MRDGEIGMDIWADTMRVVMLSGCNVLVSTVHATVCTLIVPTSIAISFWCPFLIIWDDCLLHERT